MPIRTGFPLFVILFIWGFSHSRIFHSYRDVIITGEELQILTYARYSCLLSNEGSFACHTYSDLWFCWFFGLFCLFHSKRYVTIAGEGLQSLTCARYSLPLSSALAFFSVPHLLLHRAYVYNGDPRGPVTLALIAELSLAVFTTYDYKYCRVVASCFYDLRLQVCNQKHTVTKIIQWYGLYSDKKT